MNILLVSEDFLLSGVTRHIIDIANGLAEEEHNVFVAATPSTQNGRLNSRVTFIPLPLCYPESYKKKYLGIFKSIKILIRTIRENKIEIIHTHKRYVDVIGRIAARITGVRHISTCHNEFQRYRWLSPFGDITIAPSQNIAEMLIHVFSFASENVKTVYHGIKPFNVLNDEVKKQHKQLLGISIDTRVILSVGHLNRQKDRPTLIEAIHLLQRNGQFKKAVCLIIGEGKEYFQVQKMICDYKLESHIKLMRASSDVELLNNIAEFCVLSSVFEAGPYVVLEAASIGKPSIGTAVGLTPSFIGNNEAGICVPPKNPQKLADAISYLLSNPKRTKELGKKAFERFAQDYSYDKFIRNTLSVYKEALTDKN